MLDGLVAPPVVALAGIGAAPIVGGQAFGPCLLEISGEWAVGGWDGEVWHCSQGFAVSPRYYALLPVV